MSNWIIPCNLSFFDVLEWFEHNDFVIWKQRGNYEVGDQVLIYVGDPFSEIMYLCQVEEVDVEKATIKKNSYACLGDPGINRKYIKLSLRKKYSRGASYSQLKKMGIGSIRTKIHVSDQLFKEICSLSLCN